MKVGGKLKRLRICSMKVHDMVSNALAISILKTSYPSLIFEEFIE